MRVGGATPCLAGLLAALLGTTALGAAEVQPGEVIQKRGAPHPRRRQGAALQEVAGQRLPPYTRLNYCEVIKARVRFLLGEIGEAELAAVLEPPVATMPGADASKVGMRDVHLGRRQLEQRHDDKALASAGKALERDVNLGRVFLASRTGRRRSSRRASGRSGTRPSPRPTPWPGRRWPAWASAPRRCGSSSSP